MGGEKKGLFPGRPPHPDPETLAQALIQEFGTHGSQRPKVVEGSKQTWVLGRRPVGK